MEARCGQAAEEEIMATSKTREERRRRAVADLALVVVHVHAVTSRWSTPIGRDQLGEGVQIGLPKCVAVDDLREQVGQRGPQMFECVIHDAHETMSSPP